ncbi:MAG: O-antigen polymerase [Lachnospiraceae bacterium]
MNELQIILLTAFIFLFICSYFLIDNNILAPANLYFLGCISSTIAMIYGNCVWKEEFAFSTFVVYLTGSVSFFNVSMLYKLTRRKKNIMEQAPVEECRIIRYRSSNIGFFVFFQIAVLAAYSIFFIKHSSGETLRVILRIYRNARKEGTITVPFLLGQCIKLSWALSVIEIYILVHNFTLNKKIKGQIKYIIGILAFWMLQILQSSRIYILLSFLEGFFLYILMKQKISGKRNVLSLKDIITIIIIAFTVLYGFIQIGTIIGRHSSSTRPPLYYLSMYGGSTMEILNIYIKQGITDITLLGHGTLYTFAGFDRVLNYMGLLHDTLPQTGKFVYIHNAAIGNICANYYYWLYDFGIVGVIGLSSFMAYFYNSLYSCILRKFQIGKVQFLTLIYICINYGLVMNGIADYFYRYIFSMNYFSMFIICYFILKIGFKVKLKWS